MSIEGTFRAQSNIEEVKISNSLQSLTVSAKGLVLDYSIGS